MMCNFKYAGILAITIWCLSVTLLRAECPDPSILTPCVCNDATHGKDPTITCSNLPKGFDLTKMFTNAAKVVKKKTFSVIRIENSEIDKLSAKFLSTIEPTVMQIINCTQLTYISQNSFGLQTPFVQEFVIENSPVTNRAPKRTEIFDAFNHLPCLKTLDVSGTQLSSIPPDAFSTILVWYPFELRRLLFCKPSQKCRSIETVGTKAFYYLNEIQTIDVSRHVIAKVDAFAFSLHNISDIPLSVILDDNYLNADSFDENAFQYIGRPTSLSLKANLKLTVIREEVFRSFLEDNDQNVLDVSKCPIDWSADAMQWFKALDPSVKNRIHFSQ